MFSVQIHEFAGNLLFILVLSAAVSLAFEMPFMNLDRILLMRHARGKTARCRDNFDVLSFSNTQFPETFSITQMFIYADNCPDKNPY